VACARSVFRLTMVVPASRLAMLTGYLSGQFIKMVINSIGWDGSDYCVRLENDMSFGVLVCAVTTSFYLDMRRRGFDISAVRYDDLVARPLDMCRVLMEFCGLPVSLAELAVKAFDVDSQRNSISAKSSIGHFKEQQMTPEKQAQLNELLKKYGVPLIGEPNILEGTLSCF